MKPPLAALLIVLLGPWPVTAQEQAGSIEGTVRDPSGAAVPGVRVRASAATGLAVSALAGGTGRYRFPSLPPGQYDLEASVHGFAPARADDVQLALGQTLQVDLALAAAGIAVSVTVSAEPPRLDVRQSARSTSIRDEQITLLPTGRDYTSLVTQAPAANVEGHPDWPGVAIAGSSKGEHRYVVDGMDTTHLMTGAAALGVITDAVEEVQVGSSGYAAEHSGATGSVINAITRSGANRWTGQAGAYYSADWLRGRARPNVVRSLDLSTADYRRFPKDSLEAIEPTLFVSGPLKTDVAWFFAGFAPALSSTERTVTFQPSGQTTTFQSDRKTYSGNTNVTAQAGDRTRARVAFNMSRSVVDGTLPFNHGYNNPRSNFGIVTTSPSRALSANVDYIASPRLLLSARGGRWYSNTHQDGVFQGPIYSFSTSNVGMPGVPAELQAPRGFSTEFSNAEVTKNVFGRTTAQLDATHYASAGGHHAVKVGIQVERLHNDILSGETGNVVQLGWGGASGGRRGEYGVYTVRTNGVVPERGVLIEGDVHSNNVALFAQDAWTIAGRVTLNIGLRAEKESIPSYTSAYGVTPKGIDFGFAQKLAPRLGAAWDVRGDGKWKAYGSWGLYYDAMKYTVARERFGGFKFLQYTYTLDTPDWPNLLRPGCPPACPGTLIEGPRDFNVPANTPDGNAVDPDIEPFRLQEAAVGLEHAMSRAITVGAHYLHKQVDIALDDMWNIDAAGNSVYIIGNPGFHRGAETAFGYTFPKAVRDYDALELTVDKRMASRWALHASYVLSRLYGNYTGLSYGEEGEPASNIGGTFNDFYSMLGSDGQPLLGVLPGDRTHQLKAHAVCQLAFGTSVGVSGRAMSGTPVTRYAVFGGHEIAYLGRGSDGRLPALSQLDLHVQHEIRLAGDKRLQLGVNVLNLFDQEAPLVRSPNEFLFEQVAITPEELLAGFDGSALIAEQHVARDPFFLKDHVYQPPREIRLSVKLMF